MTMMTTLPSPDYLNYLAEQINSTAFSELGIAALKSLNEHDKTACLELLQHFKPERYLAVYGTLAPGKDAHHLLSAVPGRWHKAKVWGMKSVEGWGQTGGYPAFVWGPEAKTTTTIDLFESDQLTWRWPRLDDFEGPAYVRKIVPVSMGEGKFLLANIYCLHPLLVSKVFG